MDLTPSQKDQIKTWEEQRDIWINEISILRSEHQSLIESNQDLLDSSKEIEYRMNQNLGRIKEIEVKEKERENVLSKEVGDLLVKKNSLENNIFNLSMTIGLLEEEETKIKDRIVFLSDLLGKIEGKSEIFDKIISRFSDINEEQIKKIKELLLDIEKTSKEIVLSQEESAKSSKQISDLLPMMLVEAKKQTLERNIIKKIKQE
jgi:hypothetical protein